MVEKELLDLVASDDARQSFARWEEVKNKKFPKAYLDELSQMPRLDKETERLLEDLVDRGLVEEQSSTDDYRSFRITPAGRRRLKELSAQPLGRIIRETGNEVRADLPKRLARWLFGGLGLVALALLEYAFGFLDLIHGLILGN